MPKVSIIIPLFNSVNYIKETLESAIAQSYKDLEIIVVDDHSTDNSPEIVEKFQEYYPNTIQLIKNTGKGACSARNFGFRMSSGDFIQYLDADDLISPDKIEKQLEALCSSPGKLAVCNTYNFQEEVLNSSNTDKDFIFSTNSPEIFLENLWGAKGKNHYVAVHAWLTPRRIIEKAGSWNEDLAKDQDGEFFARVVLQSEGIVYVPGIKSFYRKHTTGKNIAARKDRKHIESQLIALLSKEHQLSQKSNSAGFHKAMALQYKCIAVDSWPLFKDIYKTAMYKVQEHGNSDYLPLLGGKLVEFVKKTFGWKIAKIISYYGREIKKRIPIT